MEIPRWLMTDRSNVHRGRLIRICAGVGVALVLLFLLHSTVSENSFVLPAASHRRPPPIPNIIHYTQLQRNEHAEFHISFQSFLSVYAAITILKPTKIYIHTDFNETAIANAHERGSKFTRLILTGFPNIIKLNMVPLYTHANGHEISNIEARSDMVRWEQVYKYGGIYLDFDVLALRDVRVLREAGFNAVVGRQQGGGVNTGCFMAQKGAALTYLMQRDQWAVFDGSWERHSIWLLSEISQRLVRSPNEVLILDRPAMAPAGWDRDGAEWTYSQHENAVPEFPQINDPVEDPIARWDNKARSQDWEADFSPTYFLHAFKSKVPDISNFKKLSVKYILARKSNFALAAWPVVQQGLKEGIFVESDE